MTKTMVLLISNHSLGLLMIATAQSKVISVYQTKMTQMILLYLQLLEHQQKQQVTSKFLAHG